MSIIGLSEYNNKFNKFENPIQNSNEEKRKKQPN